MKTTILTVAAIIAVLFVGILSLNYDLTPNPHVEITSFNTTETSSGSSIGVVHVWFFLNLTNTGAGDVNDLTITFSTNNTVESNQHLMYTNSTPPYGHIAEFKLGEPCLLGGIKAGETRDFMFYWVVSSDFDAPPLIATVKSNQAILDQATIMVPPIPKVMITDFICLGTWHGTTLGAALDLFSLSCTNLGMTDVNDLIVTLNTSKTNEKDTDPTPNPRYNPNDFLDEYINGATYPLEGLMVGDTKTFEKTYFMFGAYKFVEPFALTITLKSNDIILDRATIMIPISTAA